MAGVLRRPAGHCEHPCSAPTLTEHLKTNLWLAQGVLAARVQASGHSIRIRAVA